MAEEDEGFPMVKEERNKKTGWRKRNFPLILFNSSFLTDFVILPFVKGFQFVSIRKH